MFQFKPPLGLGPFSPPWAQPVSPLPWPGPAPLGLPNAPRRRVTPQSTPTPPGQHPAARSVAHARACATHLLASACPGLPGLRRDVGADPPLPMRAQSPPVAAPPRLVARLQHHLLNPRKSPPYAPHFLPPHLLLDSSTLATTLFHRRSAASLTCHLGTTRAPPKKTDALSFRPCRSTADQPLWQPPRCTTPVTVRPRGQGSYLLAGLKFGSSSRPQSAFFSNYSRNLPRRRSPSTNHLRPRSWSR